tara:strand:+ start:245 stop:1354 length:1110 start_codon:yes stop_codon:yes gene_type:complete
MAAKKIPRSKKWWSDRERAMSGKERQTIIPENYPVGGWKDLPTDPRDLRPASNPMGDPWFAQPRKDSLKTKTKKTTKKVTGRSQFGRTTKTLSAENPYSSVSATDFLKKYYGGGLVNQINAATEAEKKNRALVGDRRQRATDIVPFYRDAKGGTFKTAKGKTKPSAGRYYSGQYNDPDSFEGKRQLHITMPSTVAKDQAGTWEHEGGHHLNLFNPENFAKIEGLLPKGGELKKAPPSATDNYIHAFYSPQELGEAMGRLQRQWYANSKTDKKRFPDGPRRMSDSDFDRMMDANEYLPTAFKGSGHRAKKGSPLPPPASGRNSGHFIRALRQYKLENPEKGGALIDQLRKVKDSFVDTGGSKFFPTENIA